MSPNELMHNADGVIKEGGIVPATTMTVTFTVDGNGTVTGSASANVGDTLIFAPAPSSQLYTGPIYATWNGTDACNTLVGEPNMQVGPEYHIQTTAQNKTFSFTTNAGYATMLTSSKQIASAEKIARPPLPDPAGANGTLYVGSGSPAAVPSPYPSAERSRQR